MATTQMDTLSPTHKESGAKTDNCFNSTDARTSKSDSSSDEERCGKTGPNKSSQNILSPSQSQKRPMNAFLIFCKRHRSVVRQKYPHLENRSITKILGEWWAALDADQKQKYTELAKQYKEAFMKANPHFKWYKTTDLRPPIAPPSPPPMAVSHLSQNCSQSQQQPQQQQQQQQQTQSTPKPPKKRYLENLENGEYKAPTNATQSAIPTPTPTSCSNAGPPILDIETANRVIENALSGSASNSFYNKSGQSAFNSDIISGHINSVLEQHTIETQELEALERSSHLAGLRSPSPTPTPTATSRAVNNLSETGSSKTTQSTIVNNSATKSISHSPLPSDDDHFDEDNDDEKPLNLSSSTVLHTSNQHIIDHFIDKLLSTGTEGTSSSSVLSLPFSSSSMSNTFTSAANTVTNTFTNNNSSNNNKMNNNCNYNNNDNNNSNNSHNSLNSNKNNSSTGNNSCNKQSRKERTCKGKRYLEILNENKLGKRNRAVSPFTGNTEKDETSLRNLNNNQLASTSKWVSGGFDLEEHIAALPQLGDTHLLNALSHSKANKTVGSNKSGANENHIKRVSNCALQESINKSGDGSVSDNDDNDTTISRDLSESNDNTLRLSTNNTIASKKSSGFTNCNDLYHENDYNNESDSERKTEDSILSNNIENKSELSELNGEELCTTQGMDCNECDGLAALAEVALQQARNTIS